MPSITLLIMPIRLTRAASTFLIPILLLVGCASAQTSTTGDHTVVTPASPNAAMESHFHFRPAALYPDRRQR